jgi:hypothetical protein
VIVLQKKTDQIIGPGRKPVNHNAPRRDGVSDAHFIEFDDTILEDPRSEDNKNVGNKGDVNEKGWYDVRKGPVSKIEYSFPRDFPEDQHAQYKHDKFPSTTQWTVRVNAVRLIGGSIVFDAPETNIVVVHRGKLGRLKIER